MHYRMYCVRFKHFLVPAIISASLDVDSNVNRIRFENKQSHIVRYLESHLSSISQVHPPSESKDANTIPPPLQSLMLSQVLPVDLWTISMIAFAD
jgi:hypothetical protein